MIIIIYDLCVRKIMGRNMKANDGLGNERNLEEERNLNI